MLYTFSNAHVLITVKRLADTPIAGCEIVNSGEYQKNPLMILLVSCGQLDFFLKKNIKERPHEAAVCPDAATSRLYQL